MPLAVQHSRDDDGRAVVGVPLSNRPGLHAWLYTEDHETVVLEYGNASWFVNDNGDGRLYVRLRNTDSHRNVMVSRLVVGDPAVSIVRYRDGDRLNLRRDNLDAVKLAPQRTARACPSRTFHAAATAST
ncbi:MAG: hypothetical protein WAP03_12775 [Methylorubrum rhodinum]|uniref:hypothetical protein n=1 Tax=Methylorubrum rhodinum TaxID=29428 RepID=UPI003BB07330